MKYEFADLVDIQKLQDLMKSFYRATGIPSGIIDTRGNIMVSVGWQKICQEFHRKNPQTECLCRKSNENINDKLHLANPYLWYKCENGLIDAVAPIIIHGEHVATIIQGQFLFEPPDVEYFRQQAKKYGFEEDKYLDAVAKIPIYSEGRLDEVMLYFIQLAGILADLGLARVRQLEMQTKKLEQSDHELFEIFRNIPGVAVQSYDADGNIMFWNAFSQNIYGFADNKVIGNNVARIFEKDTAGKILKMIGNSNVTDELQGPEKLIFRDNEGNEKIVCSTLFSVNRYSGKEFVCMDVDITEKETFKKEMLRLDRLNLIGEMAASIGHEIRNPMTTVRGYLQMLQNKREIQGFAGQFGVMIEELDRANQIITEFLSLAKDKSVDKKLNNLNDIISLMMPLMYADAARENKTIRVTLGEIPNLLMDGNEIRQLLLNLVRNGLEAMNPCGVLDIMTSRDKDEVVLVVKDNGKGIPGELMDKIGTPFFTTKSQGTGLGLAICFSIAVRHQAKIVINSNLAGTNVFTRFVI